MRKQIAAANWKMNLTYQLGERLLDDVLQERIKLAAHQQDCREEFHGVSQQWRLG